MNPVNHSAADPVHVVAAAIVNDRNQVLISLRHKHSHQGGLWEFPGGKVESGETVQTALTRELNEELGISVTQGRPLISVRHKYPDKSVLLEVWLVSQFDGEVHGREGQAVRWVSKSALADYDFPAANHPIITAVQLPDVYVITPEPQADQHQFLARLQRTLDTGIELVQLRAKSMNAQDYEVLAKECQHLCDRVGATLILNCPPELVQTLGAGGVHLTSQRLHEYRARPLSKRFLVAASCHNQVDLKQAMNIGVDFVVLAPVKPTSSHVGQKPLGWTDFGSLVKDVNCPVFALGGMMPGDRVKSFNYGGQGVAGITGFWQQG
jgi:8-oxo-dGTP diphosphatase